MTDPDPDDDSVVDRLTTDHDDARGPIEVRGGGRERREVIVPLRLYKAVTVFSTLGAILLVVVGFMLLDAATLERSFLLSVVDGLPVTLSLPVADSTATLIGVVLGLASIGVGAGVYVLGSRFRTAEMEKGKDDGDESETDG